MSKKIFTTILIGLLISFLYLNWDIAYSFIENTLFSLFPRTGFAPDVSGQVQDFKTQFKSLNKKEKTQKIYFPNEYIIDENRRFPVFYLLHGFPGTNENWIIEGQIVPTLNYLIKNKVLPPLIVVFPDGNGNTVHNSQYINSPQINQNMEDYILELVGLVDANFRTIKDRRFRAIGGLSAGGYGAMNLGLKHNDTFAHIMSHSGYFYNTEGVLNSLKVDSNDRTKNNPLDYIGDTSLDKETYIYFDIGKDDEKKVIGQNQEMDRLLTEKKVYHRFELTEGAHNWKTWSQNVKSSLEYLGANLKNLL